MDSSTKTIESNDFKIDFHKAFVSYSRDENTRQERISIVPWRCKYRNFQIVGSALSDQKLFQRMKNLSDQAIEQNIVKLVDGEEQTYG